MSNISAKDIITPDNLKALQNARNKEEILLAFDEVMNTFNQLGGKPLIWHKPIFLLVLPAFTWVCMLAFVFVFHPSLMFAFLMFLGNGVFTYYRWEEYNTQKLVIYPFKMEYTFLDGWNTVKQADLYFGTEDLDSMMVHPYGLEYLYNWLSWVQFFKPRRWLRSCDVYLINKQQNALKIPSVRKCDEFERCLLVKVEDFLKACDPHYQHKEKTLIINGKPINTPTVSTDTHSVKEVA